ncbi:alpha-L-rhamnosidase C protein [Rutstroemia sp. NJR-2017a BBW]|nr:alpha-L-rhamnosidase C protein [Rutstroemia sp. NJR-2017a BBW]
MAQDEPPTIGRRIRSSSISMVDAALNFNPQPGMWAATGTAIAYAPTLNELREPIGGGANIEFTPHGHSARTVTTDVNGEPFLAKTLSKTKTRRMSTATATILNTIADKPEIGGIKPAPTATTEAEKPSLAELTAVPDHEKHGWRPATLHALQAFWKFVLTPTGFLMTLYGLNIVAWGAMLFFLLLDAAPAMDHPSANSNDSPRKKWLEIDSQILNALFCVTGFGLAPWRFRDLYFLLQTRDEEVS